MFILLKQLIADSKGQSSSVAESTSAITSVYQLVFGTRKKYAGLFYLGLEQAETVQKLLEEFEDFSPNAVWHQTQVLKSISEIMKHLFRLHLKKAVRGSYEKWNKIFQNWTKQKSNIIELYTHIEKTYNSNYKYTECELRAWRAIFCVAGCTNITPFDNKISKNKFWTNASDPEKDCETLMNLYTEGFLNIHQPYCC
ncbi:hypothetical protein Glove_24g8 [Diversispora epigaea]|uniref:Uncharacterized protein n=1 Tax=Diversispora epigaea TaxID=1348612 RepID=A0A397JSU3_9GLOM|nr:hypothetical protein Glove_24g8 [Diversispora epigaea]